jgi:hypothetical protein
MVKKQKRRLMSAFLFYLLGLESNYCQSAASALGIAVLVSCQSIPQHQAGHLSSR